MYIFKNAIKNLGRNKGRNLISGIIIFAIILTTAVSLIINTTTTGIIEDYKNRFGSDVSINPNMEKIISQKADEGDKLNFDPITNEQYEALAKSTTLKDYNLKRSIGATLKDAKAVGEDESSMQSMMIQGDNEEEFVMPTMNILASDDLSKFTEFNEGQRKITSGEVFKNINECIVSEDFANENGLSVGSEFVIVANEKEISFKISGIYSDITDEYSGMPIKAPNLNRRNEIITSSETLASNDFANTGIGIIANYTLKNPDLLDDFRKEARALGISDFYDISTDEASYNRVVGPVEGLKDITTTFMWVVIVLGSIILILLSSMFIRERKYEIGVLRAMGMKRINLVFQFLSEMIIITALCFVLAISVGSSIAQPIANHLLANQIEVAENDKMENKMMPFSLNQNQTDDTPTISELKVSLSPRAMLEILGMSILLASMVSISSIIYITKYEPIKILTERN